MGNFSRCVDRAIAFTVEQWKKLVDKKLYSAIPIIWITGFAIAASSLWLFSQVAVKVLANETQSIDMAILLKIHSLHFVLLDQIMIAVTFLGEPDFLAIISGIFAALLLVQRRYLTVVILTVLCGGGIYLNNFLKESFSRIRPSLWEKVIEVNNFSFPSGHAMISLVIYGFIGYWLIVNYQSWKNLIFLITGLLILAIGFSRLYLGVHWATDILAGYAVGFVWLFTCLVSYKILGIAFKRYKSIY